MSALSNAGAPASDTFWVAKTFRSNRYWTKCLPSPAYLLLRWKCRILWRWHSPFATRYLQGGCVAGSYGRGCTNGQEEDVRIISESGARAGLPDCARLLGSSGGY